jgi:hypothetical protein
MSSAISGSQSKVTKGELDVRVANSEPVRLALDQYARAYRIKQFWIHIIEMLEFVAKRIDSAMMSIGVDAKIH